MYHYGCAYLQRDHAGTHAFASACLYLEFKRLENQHDFMVSVACCKPMNPTEDVFRPVIDRSPCAFQQLCSSCTARHR
jgi:hypothetical protein